MLLENQHLFMTVRTSRAYLWFNVLQLALTFGLLLCFFDSRYQLLAILQILVAFFLALDIIIRYFSERSFFRQRSNIYDLVLLTVITLTMVLDILLPVRFHHRADGLTLLFFGVRYSAQLLRFLLILKKSYEAKGMSSIKEISFSGIDKAELEDEVHYDRVFHEHIVKGIMP